jgi:hypothetical protein
MITIMKNLLDEDDGFDEMKKCERGEGEDVSSSFLFESGISSAVE